MDKDKIINLEKEMKKQQRTIEDFTQEDINNLTVEGMQHLAETMDSFKDKMSETFDMMKFIMEVAKQNQERIEALEKSK